MRPRIVIIMILALVVAGVFASVAWAGSSTSTIIGDASDGTVNGHYSASQVRAALTAVENDPTYSQYSDIAGVLQDYLSSLSTSGSTTTTGGTQTTAGTRATTPTTLLSGELDYTGGQPLLVFAIGGVLLAAGTVLRRRWA
jgi:hypothetical protein